MEEEIDTFVDPPSTGDDDINVAPVSQLSVSRFSFQLSMFGMFSSYLYSFPFLEFYF